MKSYDRDISIRSILFLTATALIIAASFGIPTAAVFAVDSCDEHCDDACETCCDCIQCIPSLYMVSPDGSGIGVADPTVSWWLHSTSVHPDGALAGGIDRPPQLSL